jgi:uncharacterized alpha-E superfamily protein
MSRYVERAENVARFLDVTYNMALDMPPGSGEQWGALISASGDNDDFKKRYGAPTRDNVAHFLLFDVENQNSILSCLATARENARGIREVISSEMWEQLNSFYNATRDSQVEGFPKSPSEFFQFVKNSCHLFLGITIATFSQGEAWHFARLGRVLERADKTSRILDVKYFTLLPNVHSVGMSIDDLQWSAVLRSVSGFEMYRKRYRGVTPKRVVEYLVLDQEFPRAIMHCVQVADKSLHAISGSAENTYSNDAEKRIGQLRSEMAYTDVNEIIETGLHEFLDSIQSKLNDVGSGIHDSFIAMEPEAKAAV